MGNLVTKIKNSKFVNSGVMKKIKDKIYYKYINPREEKRTDKYREEIITVFNKVCDGYKWGLLCGAFLRYYRDNTMDGQDLDFFVDENDFEKIKDKFIEEKFKIKQLFINPQGVITEYRFMYKNAEVDVFKVFKDKECPYHYFTFEKKNAKNIDKKVNGNILCIEGKDYISYRRNLKGWKNLIYYDYKNTKFMAPKNADKILEDMYGKEWKVYDPNYDPRTAPKTNMPIPYEGAKSIVYINPIDTYEKNR